MWIAEDALYEAEAEDVPELDFAAAAEEVPLESLVQYVFEGHPMSHDVALTLGGAPEADDDGVVAVLDGLRGRDPAIIYAAGLGAAFPRG